MISYSTFSLSFSSVSRDSLDIVHLSSPDYDPSTSSTGELSSIVSAASSTHPIMGGSQSTHPAHPASRRTSTNNGHQGNGAVDMRKPAGIVSGAAGPQKGVNRRPMPGEEELERRFNEVLIQMDLPPERAKHLRLVAFFIHSYSLCISCLNQYWY